jgi:heavy metal sensor kinase
MLFALGVFGTFVYLTVSRWSSTSLDDSLRLSATQLIATSDIDHGKLDLSDDPISLNAGMTDELRSRGLSIQIFSTSGVLLQSLGSFAGLNLDPADLGAALEGRTSLGTRDDPAGVGAVRVHTQPITADGRVVAVVQVSESLRSVEALRQTLLTTILLGSPVLVAVAGVGGYVLARRALAPIDQITRTARRISAEDLSGRLGLPPSRDEVGRLAGTFDDMLGRLDGAFRRERQFTHDAAHELRTPLAAMQSILSVIGQRRRTAAEYEVALSDLGEETARLSALTEDLLRLARAESPMELTEAVDLSTLLPDVVETMRAPAEAKDLVLAGEVDGDLRIVGDTDALIRLLVNLIENAIKYTARGSVMVFADGADDQVVIRVVDTGEGIAPTHLPHVFERFYRAEEARATPGTGLGLAICAEIVNAHGGAIGVESEPGEGSTFTVTLPRTPHPAA